MILVLITGWIFSGWPQIGSFSPEIQVAQALTTLTAYLTSTAATTISTANQISSSAPASETSQNTKIAKQTGYCELYSQGNTGSGCSAGASAPSPSGHGFLWDVTTLEAQQILAGNWTGAMKLAVSKNGVTVTAYMRAFKYNSSVYTQVATSTSNSIALTTTPQALTFSAGSGALTNFNTSDKLYIDFVVNITSNTANSNTETISLYQNGGAAEQMVTPGYQPQPITFLGDGTNPPDKTLAPGATATSSDIFTFSTNSGTESITNVTTTLAGTGQYAGISKVEIVDEASTTVYGSVTNPSADAFSISLTGLTAGTTTSTLQIRITPFSATGMPAVPGALYTVTSTITAWTGASGNLQSGTDSGSATVTIDNLSPSDVTNATSTPSSGQVAVNWTNPSDSDYATTTVLRATSTIGGLRPTEGTTYATGTAITATTTVACVVGGAAGANVGCTDTGLVNGTTYYYKIFAADAYANYSQNGVETSSTPAVASTVSCSTDITSTAFGTLSSASISTASPNASTTMSCSGTSSGCTLYVKDAGSGSNPGLWRSASPTYLIASADATLSAGTDGYGIQATTTASGSGGTLSINTIYNKTGNDVGGFSLSDLTLASSTIDVTGREVVATHKAAVNTTTLSGSYADTITYSCLVN